MTTIAFSVPGAPVPKGRPRATTIAGRARLYTPARTSTYESTVRLFAAQAMAGAEPVTGPLFVLMTFVLPVPQSWSKRKQAAALAGEVYPTGKPDSTNLAKAVEDGCNGVVWVDDSQIVDTTIRKRYGSVPRAQITVTWTNAASAALEAA